MQKKLENLLFMQLVCSIFLDNYYNIVGFGAIAFLNSAEGAQYFVDGKLFGGSNMASVHLSHMLGGKCFLGFISAVAFATILAVVSGLTLAGASAISHDIYAM